MTDREYLSVPMLECRYVEFLRIRKPEDADMIAQVFLGDGANHLAYTTQFGINLLDYKGFYMEVGYVPAPQGPLMPTTVQPILLLRRTHSGVAFKPQVLKVKGYVNREGRYAWIDAGVWEAELGDSLAEDLRKRVSDSPEADAQTPDDERIVVNGKAYKVDELKKLIADPGIKRLL